MADDVAQPAAPLKTTRGSPATVRALWEASRALLAAAPGLHLAARGVLHREALDAAAGAWPPGGAEAYRWALERRLGPDAEALVRHARSAPLEGLDAFQLSILEVAHELALDGLEKEVRQLARSRELRWLGVGTLLTLGVAVLVGLGSLWGRRHTPVDLAKGKPWVTSSVGATCVPAERRCGQERMATFFVTRDEPNPWFRVDLGEPTPISSLTVVNRSDMLRERAVPLVAEASTDGEHWQELSRQPAVFDRWDPSFPSVAARYVRLRAERFTTLHLERVEVHP